MQTCRCTFYVCRCSSVKVQMTTRGDILARRTTLINMMDRVRTLLLPLRTPSVFSLQSLDHAMPTLSLGSTMHPPISANGLPMEDVEGMPTAFEQRKIAKQSVNFIVRNAF